MKSPVLLTTTLLSLSPALGAQVEIGPNDRRLSSVGLDGDPGAAARHPAIAHNASRDEYLVVWEAVGDGPSRIDGRRVDGATGAPLSGDVSFSDTASAIFPAVAHDPIRDEYLVVWIGDDPASPGLDVFARRLDAAGSPLGAGQPVGGSPGSFGGTVAIPDVAFCAATGRYLVTWYGSSLSAGFSVFGQLLDGLGNEVGPDDFPISDSTSAFVPDIAVNEADGEFLVVWFGSGVGTGTGVHGQRVDAASGLPIGTDDFPISGPASTDPAVFPAVAFDPDRREYLVVWQASADLGGVDPEVEIFGRRLDAVGSPIGADGFRISEMGPDGDPAYRAFAPSVTHDAVHGEYFVVWRGVDDAAGLAPEEGEIYGQRIDAATGFQVGFDDVRLSDMGPDGDASFGPTVVSFARGPEVAAGSTGRLFAVWPGVDGAAPLAPDEAEVHGQWIAGGPAHLSADVNQLSAFAGGQQQFALDAGPENAGSIFVLLGSIGGISPGIDLGGAILPLNPGPYFQITIVNPGAYLSGSLGQLDGAGRASASLSLPAGLPLAGLVVHHAFALLTAPFASNPVSCTLVP